MEERTRTLLCGDLFTQGGTDNPALTESDILGPSEAFRLQMDYFSHTKHARPMLERLAAARPTTLACMHGSAFRGDGASLLRALADALGAGAPGREGARAGQAGNGISGPGSGSRGSTHVRHAVSSIRLPSGSSTTRS